MRTNQNSEQYMTHRLNTIYANPATGEEHLSSHI